MPLPSDLIREGHTLLSLALNWFRNHWRPFTAFQAVLLLLIWFGLHPFDHSLIDSVRGPDPTVHKALAGWLSKWGDFPGFNVILTLGLWLAGQLCHKPKWKRLALMTFLCAAMAGLTTDAVRAGLGRARPYSKQPDSFYGPSLKHEFQSCPSGHSSTAFGAALPLLLTAPALGVPATLFAASVAWSRMYLHQHYPSDVALGLWMALWFAVPLGKAARVRRISDEP